MIQEIESSIETLTQEIAGVNQKIETNSELVRNIKLVISKLAIRVNSLTPEQMSDAQLDAIENEEKQNERNLLRASRVGTALKQSLTALESQLAIEQASLKDSKRDVYFNEMKELAFESNKHLEAWSASMDELNAMAASAMKVYYRSDARITDYQVLHLQAQKAPRIGINPDKKTFYLEYRS